MSQKLVDKILSAAEGFTYEELMEVLRYKVEQEDIPFHKIEHGNRYLKSSKINKVNEGKDVSPRKYADLEMGVQSFLNVLENDLLYQDALDDAAISLGRGQEYATETKHSPYRYSKDVVKAHKDNATLKDIKDTVRLRDIDITKSSTLWQLINLLSRKKELYDQFIELVELVERQGNDIETLKAENSLQDADINTLKEMVGVEDLPNKDKAYILFSKNIKTPQIAEKLGVSARTVRRWKKEYENQ